MLRWKRMIFRGSKVSVRVQDDGIAELCFDSRNEKINKLDVSTLHELLQAVTAIENCRDITGMLLSSSKEDFMAGPDLDSLSKLTALPACDIESTLLGIHDTLNRIEDLPFPTATAINGKALAGGFEICLATDFRVLARDGGIGLPETRFGMIPMMGATVRLTRLIGIDLAAEWIISGQSQLAESAIAAAAVDAVVAPEALHDAALDILKKCISGQFNFLLRRREKADPVQLSADELEYAVYSSSQNSAIFRQPLNAAPRAVIEVIQQHAQLNRAAAQKVESRIAAKLAQTSATQSLIGTRRKERVFDESIVELTGEVSPVAMAAVVGAGVMGSGIASQSALMGISTVLKDVDKANLDLAWARCNQATSKVAAGHDALGRIIPTLSYSDFGQADIILESVAESASVKKAVLTEIETATKPSTVITSNTSSLSITRLAEHLKRPMNFCGMHFFNPVQKMPLVEIVRGERTSNNTITRVASLAARLGKKPVVVRDCPGFLVNRILYAYFLAFLNLLASGSRIDVIDKAMRKFGWPMGPGQLLDAIGIDVLQHSATSFATGYADRMVAAPGNAITALYECGRMGLKAGRGFYLHSKDSRGRPKMEHDDSVYTLFAHGTGPAAVLDTDQIIERLMIPLCIEATRCLEDRVVESASILDMALIYATGFPDAHGGPLGWIEEIGVADFVQRADRLISHGPLYRPTDMLRDMAKSGLRFAL